MKKTLKHTMAVLLALALTVGAGGALAYSTPDFTDVAAGNWAYAPVMQMADEGIIKGTSSTTFAPEMKVSAAMWLTLLGRAVYDADAKAAAQTGDAWYSAYVRVAESKGLLTGTNITLETIEGEISRNDMAVTLHGAVKLLGGKDAAADTSKIAEYGEVPTKYAAAVAQAYAQGLIKGDGQGRFNGAASMRRDEAATVMVRLLDLKAKLESEANRPIEPENPPTGKTVTFTVTGSIYRYEVKPTYHEIPLPGVAFTFYYKDGRALASGVSGKDGSFTLDISVDEADYTPASLAYYTIAEEYTDPTTGIKYNSDAHPQPLTLTTFQNDWDITMYAN